ncbi:unnamed protein product [Clavelina lepadiformis]|uniref:Uncharacterized protein n=1 Tax=Clavelina lepadiformis TaxID=159417 RepID=A0ABP0FDD6_CLALP
MHFFQKKPNSENQVSGCYRTEEETTTSDLQHGLKRSCKADMDYAETSKKRKRDFIRQYDSKYLEFGFTIAPSGEKVPLPMCSVCAKILSNDAMKLSNAYSTFSLAA